MNCSCIKKLEFLDYHDQAALTAGDWFSRINTTPCSVCQKDRRNCCISMRAVEQQERIGF